MDTNGNGYGWMDVWMDGDVGVLLAGYLVLDGNLITTKLSFLMLKTLKRNQMPL